MKYVATALLAVGLSSAALADEVFLTNCRSLVGIVHNEPNRVLVETRLGDIGIPHAEVKEVAGRVTEAFSRLLAEFLPVAARG